MSDLPAFAPPERRVGGATPSAAINDLRRALSLWRIWTFRAYESISARYRRSLLGPFWIAASMAATSLALSLVFGGVFHQPLRQVLPFITAGILAWGTVAMALLEAPDIFVLAGGIIKNHHYPYMYYIVESTVKNLIQFAHNIIVFFLFEAAVGAFTIPSWTIFPGLILVALGNLFWCTIVAMYAARFRDIRFLLPYVAQLLFFLTPIFWQPSAMGGTRAIVAKANPFYHLVELIRAPLLGHMPTLSDWEVGVASLVLGILIWLLAFTYARRRIPFWV